MNLLASIEKLGAGWWVPFRNSVEAEAKTAWDALIASVAPEAKADLVAAVSAGEAAALAAIKSGSSWSDAAPIALQTAEKALEADGVGIGQDVLQAAVTAMLAAAKTTSAP